MTRRRIHIWAYPLGPGPGCRWLTLCGREVAGEAVEDMQEPATCQVCLRLTTILTASHGGRKMEPTT